MASSPAWYGAYGLSIVSEFDIPGAIRIEPADQADITVSAGGAELGASEATSGPYIRHRDALLFDAPGVARYLARSRNLLLVDPYPDADEDEICALLIATALPMLLWMRGGLVLHAAGVVLPGSSSAIALAGPSGVGKSSLAHGLLANGARIVGDDSLWLVRDGGRAMVSGMAGGCFLPRVLDASREFVPAAPHTQAATTELKALVVLRRSDPSEPSGMRRLCQAEALEALLRQRHRPRIPTILGREAAVFQECVLLSRNLPIYELASADGDISGTNERIAAAFS